MKLERIQTSKRLPIQVEEAWDFFTSPENLQSVMPPWLDYQLSSSPPEYLHPGAMYSAQMRPFPGVTLHTVNTVMHIRPPSLFITEQRVGPFKLWHHEYHFKELQDGVVVDEVVQYGMRYGPMGRLVHDLFVRKRLHAIFMHRARALDQRFGAMQRQQQPQQPFPLDFQTEQLQQQLRPEGEAQPRPQPQPQQPAQQKPHPSLLQQQQQTRPKPKQKPNPTPQPDRPITLEDIFGGTPDD